MAETRADRIRLVNELLPWFSPGLQVEERKGKLWLAFTDGKCRVAKAAVLTRCGSSLACRYGLLGMGGTRAGAVAMLVRWIRDDTRLPLASWRYWCGPTVGLARPRGAEFLAVLEATSYGDPGKAGCVFCGSAAIVDWWSRAGDPQGPCCSHLGCTQRAEP